MVLLNIGASEIFFLIAFVSIIILIKRHIDRINRKSYIEKKFPHAYKKHIKYYGKDLRQITKIEDKTWKKNEETEVNALFEAKCQNEPWIKFYYPQWIKKCNDGGYHAKLKAIGEGNGHKEFLQFIYSELERDFNELPELGLAAYLKKNGKPNTISDRFRIVQQKDQIHALDKLERDYKSIADTYPLGLKEFSKIKGISPRQRIQFVLDSKDAIAQYENIVNQYHELKNRYSKGIQEYALQYHISSPDDDKARIVVEKQRIIDLDEKVRKYERIKKDYPNGLQEFCKNQQKTKDEVINNLDEISQLDSMILDTMAKVDQLEQKYSKDMLQKYWSWKNISDFDYNDPSTWKTWQALLSSDNDDIQKFIESCKKERVHDKWEDDHEVFAKKSRELMDHGCGCYFYDIQFEDGDFRYKKERTIRVWQHFYNYWCNEDLDYIEPYHKVDQSFYNGLVDKKFTYKEDIQLKIFSFLLSLDSDTDDDVLVIFGNSGLSAKYRNKKSQKEFNEFHFSHLIDSIEEPFDFHYTFGSDIDFKTCPHNWVVVETITTNDHLKSFCQKLLEKALKADFLPNITYFTLFKEHDKVEMQELIDQRKKDIENERLEKIKEEQKRREQEEAARKRREQEENRRRELEEAKRRERELRNSIINITSNWTCIKGVNCFSMYYYYPTTCSWDADEDVWDVRNMVWRFKFDPSKTSSFQHGQALSQVVRDATKTLKIFFGTNKLSRLTLVCICASSQEATERRYHDFSQKLCNNTGMDNGYDYVTVIKDAIPKHLGGDGEPQVRIDSDFFNGRLVLLFDDVITTGKSMAEYANRLSRCGAIVIGGLSIGRTKHDYVEGNPIDDIGILGTFQW